MAGRDGLLDEMQRSFQVAAGALVMILVTVVAMVIGQANRLHWASHARDVTRIARDARSFALERETGIRGFLLSGNRELLDQDSTAAHELPIKVDSLVLLTADNPEQNARAIALRASITRWVHEYAEPAVRREPPPNGLDVGSRESLLGKPLFDHFRADIGAFLSAEEELYRRRTGGERLVRLLAFSLLLAEILTIAALLRRFRRRVVRQTHRIVMQRDEISIQSARVKLQNEELLHSNTELQEQAIMLEEQQTELEVTLDELRHSEERFRTLISSMSDIVYTIDLHGRTDGLLGNWVEHERVDPGLFLGKTATEIFGEKYGEQHRAANERALHGENVVYDWNTKPGPEQRFFTTALAPLRDAGGRIIGAVGVGRDVTDRHRKEAELTSAQERLRHAQKLEAVGQLAGGVAHDFNNLLTVITAYSDMLAMEMQADDPMRESIEEIRQASGRAAALTKQLLAFSRRQQLHPQAVDLNEIIHGVENLIARLLGPEHQFLVQLSPDIDGILADRGQLEQILMNLAANARDAMPEPGRFTLTTSRVTLDDQGARIAGLPAGGYVVLAARDTGIGMTPETRARLFEPFFTTKDVGKGTGLGLATVYGIVEQSRGHIRVDSEPGRGATFSVYLPSLHGQYTPISAPSIATTNTVLLVDDEQSVRTAAAKLLREHGYEVLEASSGEEALAILRLNPGRVEVLLTDMVMPGLSGRELAEIARREDPGIAVAIMSGFIRESLIQASDAGGDVVFVEKPFTLFSLTSALREAAHAMKKQ